MQTALSCRDRTSQSQVLNKHHVQSLQVTARTRGAPSQPAAPPQVPISGDIQLCRPDGDSQHPKASPQVLSNVNLEVSNREFIQMQLESELALSLFFFFFFKSHLDEREFLPMSTMCSPDLASPSTICLL